MKRWSGKRQAVIHTAREIRGIRAAARAAAAVLQNLCETVRPGMSTLDVDRLADDLIRQAGGTSAFHGYHGFPAQICISVNDEVVHGIGRPDRVIQPGDLVSLDVGVCLNGFIGDTAATVCAGGAACRTPLATRLVAVANEGLARGVEAAVAGNHVNDIGRAVEAVVSGPGSVWCGISLGMGAAWSCTNRLRSRILQRRDVDRVFSRAWCSRSSP